MLHLLRSVGRSISVLVLLSIMESTHAQEIELIGVLEIAGDSRDLSGLDTLLVDNVAHNSFGGISGIEYVGNEEYVLIADRGPFDGASNYQCRIHRIELRIDEKQKSLSMKLLATMPLRANNKSILGAIQPENDHMRLDPESIRRTTDGKHFLISDEYGPSICKFDLDGMFLQHIDTPAWYQPKEVRLNPDEELAANEVGRQPNGGFESMCITATGSVVAMLQKPLIQDFRCRDASSKMACALRVLRLDRSFEKPEEYLYPMDSIAMSTSEILSVNEDQFLVIERDSKQAASSESKKLYLFDLSQATDVYSQQPDLAEGYESDRVTACSKKLFLDFLDSSSGLKLEQVGAKIEGLCFGPDLPDGRKLLLVATDNDFIQDKPTFIYAFGIRSETYTRQ